MALDFFICSDTSKYKVDGFSFAFSESTHNQVFSFLDRQPDRLVSLPMLARMQDYYADCQYPPNDLKHLMEDITSVLLLFDPRTQASLDLQEFQKFCLRAQEQGETIYAGCD